MPQLVRVAANYIRYNVANMYRSKWIKLYCIVLSDDKIEKKQSVKTFRLKQRQILTSFKCLLYMDYGVYFACDEAKST